MIRPTTASVSLNVTEKSLQEQIELLQVEKTKLQAALNTANKVNAQLGCVHDMVKGYLDEVTSKYVVDGKWVTLGISGWVSFGKTTFGFVKTTLSQCFGVTFSPRVPSWVSQVIDFITKNV